jgi:hypothetical protein
LFFYAAATAAKATLTVTMPSEPSYHRFQLFIRQFRMAVKDYLLHLFGGEVESPLLLHQILNLRGGHLLDLLYQGFVILKLFVKG